MATTDTTTILSFNPLQEEDHHHSFLRHSVVDSFMDKLQTSPSGEMVNTISEHTNVATSPNSTVSSSSSRQTSSRLSLPALWNSSSTLMDLSSSSSASTLWPSHPSTACTTTCDNDIEKHDWEDLQHRRRQSLDAFPQGRYYGLTTPLNHTAPLFLDQTKKQQHWHESANGRHDLKDTQKTSWMAPPSSNYTTSCHPLRSIWSTSPMEQQQPYNHQRRMSLSNERVLDDPSAISGAHPKNLDQVSSYGRRHSLAGPLMMNKSPPPPTYSNNNQCSMNARPFYSGIINDGYTMNAIDEFDTYNNPQYSRQQQLELNRRILDHIDEYFGGSGSNNNSNHGTGDQGDHHPHLTPFCTGGTPTPGSNNLQQYDLSSSSMGGPSYSNNHLVGQTMTAGGDAVNYGSSSTVLMGKGIPLHHFLNSNTLLYSVEFKANRTDTCYIMQGDPVVPNLGDLVIVEADRGHDLGKVFGILTANDIMQQQQQRGTRNDDDEDTMTMDESLQLVNGTDNPPMTTAAKAATTTTTAQKLYARRLYRLADTEEKMSLATKKVDEEKALMVCQAKIQQKELPMQVVDAEYQWDRRKLTFYYLAEHRIDFRELVRELFKNYKTRIWMCALKPSDDSSANE